MEASWELGGLSIRCNNSAEFSIQGSGWFVDSVNWAMAADTMPLRIVFWAISGWVHRQQQDVVEYLVEESRTSELVRENGASPDGSWHSCRSSSVRRIPRVAPRRSSMKNLIWISPSPTTWKASITLLNPPKVVAVVNSSLVIRPALKNRQASMKRLLLKVPCRSHPFRCSQIWRLNGTARSSREADSTCSAASSKRLLLSANLYEATLRPNRSIRRRGCVGVVFLYEGSGHAEGVQDFELSISDLPLLDTG